MGLIPNFIDFILNLDKYLGAIIQSYGIWAYVLLFLIIFCETGLVITPFLPGDSMVFAAGTFAAIGSLNVYWLFILLSAAAITGDTINYWIGYFVGPKIFWKETGIFLNKKYLEQTRQFYEKHGGKTIIIARFVPIIRTFAPFVAGIGKMSYWRFISYNVFGGIFWVGLFSFGGYYFGTISAVKNNFTLLIATIIIISFMPMIIEFLRHRKISHFFWGGDAHQR